MPDADKDIVQLRVLLVEDEQAVLRMTARALELIGCKVFMANNPADAILMAKEHSGQLDLLITDVVMPGMNGSELARTIKGLCPDIRRLFMSGYTADVIPRGGLINDGIHFIQKPFSREALANKISQIMSSP